MRAERFNGTPALGSVALMLYGIFSWEMVKQNPSISAFLSMVNNVRQIVAIQWLAKSHHWLIPKVEYINAFLFYFSRSFIILGLVKICGPYFLGGSCSKKS